MSSNEADTCREFVIPQLTLAGWDRDPRRIAEQYFFTDGRVLVSRGAAIRQKRKFADYLLYHTYDFPVAVVEAKRIGRRPHDGLQQAKDYAEILGLKFAYCTNGQGIVEFDYLSGRETELATFPTPDELWQRLHGDSGLNDGQLRQWLAPYTAQGNRPRYYQHIAINRVIQAILRGQKRSLLTLATGTGKTTVALQISWKLWSTRWNNRGDANPPRILFLADRNILIDDPKDKDFIPFGDAREKIENGRVLKSRQMYFAIYQALTALAEDGRPIYQQFAPDFFDLIIIDECHRGSASEESSWRDILQWFQPAYQLGMTATPKRDDNVDTYRYFGNPLYTYSLKQGIEDGFLAPYRVQRVITSVDAAGWRPSQGEIDRYGREIPDDEYQTKDFERVIALRTRTEAIAKHLTNYLRTTDRFAKTLVFCVDQDHAAEMRRALVNLNSDLVQQYPDYVCRVTTDEKEIGIGHLGRFQDIDAKTPVILTTSQLLTTGVNAIMVKNVVLARVVGSMTEFKQIIGRGTRISEENGKLFFTILDYTGTATAKFADPGFDGQPALITQEEIDLDGNVTQTETSMPESESEIVYEAKEEQLGNDEAALRDTDQPTRDIRAPHKYYFDGGNVEIIGELVYDLDPSGKQISVTKLIDHGAKQIRTLYRNTEEIRALWADPSKRNEIVERLAERGINFDQFLAAAGQPDADPFDLLCHVAFDAPIMTRRERAEKLRRNMQTYFDQYGPQARVVLADLLDKYAAHGIGEFIVPDALKIPPISERGNVSEIINFFGGTEQLKQALGQLQQLLLGADLK